MVADMTDMFILLVGPGAGDELQGIKKGIVEAADMIIVNKADGDLKVQAGIAEMEYTAALRWGTTQVKGWTPVVKSVSSVENSGFEEVWKSMLEYYAVVQGGEMERKRGEQRKKWMWRRIVDMLVEKVKRDVSEHKMEELEEDVYEGKVDPGTAADIVIRAFRERDRK
jgi:LAO/AO transport system kinase